MTQAVMFCLMDVSGSMTEAMKDLAKRFFMLLHAFLIRRYKRVDVVFIRHDDEAEEVDHDTFFYDRKTGGTKVSTALVKMLEVAAGRYSKDHWNIYGAQVSDGGNYGEDNAPCAALLDQEVLPMCQQYVYIEVGDGNPSGRATDLWSAYDKVVPAHPHFRMAHLSEVDHLIALFHEMWGAKGKTHV